jgi:DNA end-binding protein Ku
MVSFGLVTIPVKLYSTGETAAGIQLNMLHAKCGSRLKQQYVCPLDDEVVGRDEMVKGYEYAKGQYVLFSEDELKALNREATNAIDITEFVPLEQVDPIFYEKSYYMGPDKGGDRPYRLLAEAMRQTSRAALARYAARGKNYLVLLRPFGDGLIMQQLRYHDELRPFSEVPIGPAEVREPELRLAKQIIEQIANDRFEPDRYEDEVRQQTMELIERKVAGQEISAAPIEAPKAQVIDLMAALKASLSPAAAATPGTPSNIAKPARLGPRGRGPSPASPARPAISAKVGDTEPAAAPRRAARAGGTGRGATAERPETAAAAATPLASRKPPKPSPRRSVREERTAAPAPAKRTRDAKR